MGKCGMFESHSSFACLLLVNDNVRDGGVTLRGPFPSTPASISYRVKVTLVILRKRNVKATVFVN